MLYKKNNLCVCISYTLLIIEGKFKMKEIHVSKVIANKKRTEEDIFKAKVIFEEKKSCSLYLIL